MRGTKRLGSFFDAFLDQRRSLPWPAGDDEQVREAVERGDRV